MYYEINVSHEKTGHVFATHRRSLENVPEEDAQALFTLLVEKFPQPDYRVHMVKNEETGTFVADTHAGKE